MKRNKGHLSRYERQEIYQMQERGESLRSIGRKLGRDVSVISREVKRNRGHGRVWLRASALERASEAHGKAQERKRRKPGLARSKLERSAELQRRVLSLLKEEKYSPEEIAMVISQSDLGVKLSGKTIRRWVQKDYPDYCKHFPHRGKRPRRCLTPGRNSSAGGSKRSIAERPEEANTRARLGDFEADLIVCSQSKVCLLSIYERQTRYPTLRLLPNREASTVRQALIEVFREIPHTARKSITFDRGSEFAEVEILEKILHVQTYFCDAYSSWQKGGVEQQNRQTRRDYPKKTDLSKVSAESLKRTETRLRNRPMACLGGISPSDAWLIALKARRELLH